MFDENTDFETYHNDDVDEEFVKERLAQKRKLDMEENLDKISNLKGDYSEDQKEAMLYAANKGIPVSFLEKLGDEPLKIYALADAYETYPSNSMLEKLVNLNFMQIRWCIIPMIKREIQIMEESKEENNAIDLDDEREKTQPLEDNVITSQLSILQYMYESLMTGESFVFDSIKEVNGRQVKDVKERFLITYSGKQSPSGYHLKRVMFSHGFYNEVKPLFIFSIDNKKNPLGSFKMYSTETDKDRELDLNIDEFNLIYNNISIKNVKKTLDEEIRLKANEAKSLNASIYKKR